MAYQHAFAALADPTRRGLYERLRRRPHTVGELARVARITQPAVSQHLRVLRESGFVTVRPDGARRLYALSPEPLTDVDAWLDRFRRFWGPPLDALDTELRRGDR